MAVDTCVCVFDLKAWVAGLHVLLRRMNLHEIKLTGIRAGMLRSNAWMILGKHKIREDSNLSPIFYDPAQ
jgi:hypothetical protein